MVYIPNMHVNLEVLSELEKQFYFITLEAMSGNWYTVKYLEVEVAFHT